MESDNSPMRHEGDDNRQISVWTPEDAARFLSSAIQEAQRPLTDALRQRSVSPGMFALVIALLVACAAVCGWVLVDRLDKADRATEQARIDRDVAVDKRHEIQAKSEAAVARLSSAQELAERNRRELENENERLRTEATGLKASDEELKRLRGDLNRYRRQNELLRTQISGLEMEKQALARQLTAVKALAAPEDDEQADAVHAPAPTIEDALEAKPAAQSIAAPAPAAPAPAASPAPEAPAVPAVSQPAAEPIAGGAEADPTHTPDAAAQPESVSENAALQDTAYPNSSFDAMRDSIQDGEPPARRTESEAK